MSSIRRGALNRIWALLRVINMTAPCPVVAVPSRAKSPVIRAGSLPTGAMRSTRSLSLISKLAANVESRTTPPLPRGFPDTME